MTHFFREVRVLREEGKLHTRLLVQTRILAAISVILLGIVIYNVIWRGANPLWAAGLACVGLIFGFFVFSRMATIQWNEEQEVVEMGRMDKVGYGILAIYIALEISLRTVLNDFFPLMATALLLSGVFGILFGRVIGTVVKIHRVYLASHSD